MTLSLLLAATTWLAQGQSPLELQFLGRYVTNTYDAGGTEITAFDATSKRLFSVNGSTGKVDIINFANPRNAYSHYFIRFNSLWTFRE
ncbi:MAG: hypothetical protein IPP46_08120 [Bacteroidetes bacterium]|nr:hypothetical protein [Bacteroidota bacterium]